MNALVAGKTLAASVRIRLCRSDSTVDQLASQLEGLQIGSRTALDRIATLDRRSLEGDVVAVSGARSGQLVKPVGGSLEAAITRPVKSPRPASSTVDSLIRTPPLRSVP